MQLGPFPAVLVLMFVASIVQAQDRLPAPVGWPQPEPAPATPGPAYQPPIDAKATSPAKAPQVYEHTADAGPDQTFFAVGAALRVVHSRERNPGGRWGVMEICPLR